MAELHPDMCPRCLACDYLLQPPVGERCPECGWRIPPFFERTWRARPTRFIKRPLAFRIVAGLFILEGAIAALKTVVLLLSNTIHIDFSLIGFFIGFGILNLKPLWRKIGIYWTIFGIALVFLGITCVGGHSGPLTVDLLGIPIGQADPLLVIPVLVFSVGISIWQLWVLNRPDVKLLFMLRSLEPLDPPPPPASPPAAPPNAAPGAGPRADPPGSTAPPPEV